MIIRHSSFPVDAWGHGGAKRSAQISEILTQNGLTDRLLPPTPEIKPIGKLMLLQRGIQSYFELPQFPGFSINFLRKFGRERNTYKSEFEDCKGGVFLWESTLPKHWNFFALAHASHLPVIALPHNLEALVPRNASMMDDNPVVRKWFEKEVALFKHCSCVFTISREEQWLLRLQGVDAEYLPYYPVSSVVEYYNSIRSFREQNTTDDFMLMLGSASNPPTYSGMVECIQLFLRRPQGDLTLHVAGYQTEALRKEFSSDDRIKIHGTVTNEQMADLLKRCRAMLIHTSPSTGALTRIPEMLLAGVVVVVNANAVRSWENIPGVWVYNTDEELESLLEKDFPSFGAPARPVAAEKRFVDRIKTVCDGGVG